MNIAFNKYCLLICLGLFIVQPTFAQDNIPDEDITLSISDLKDGDTVPEGQSINAQVGGGNSRYDYSFIQDSITLVQEQSTASVLSLSIPEDLVAADATTRRVVYTISVDNGRNEVSAMIALIVSKTNNGDPQLELNVSGEALSLSHDANDPDGLGSYIYRWQRRDEGEGEWTDISDTNRYGLASNSTATIRYRVLVSYIDGQGNSNDYLVGPFPADVDVDSDGLIDIYYLEDLDAVRYQSNGSGYSVGSDVAVKISQGCPMAGCRGYELLRDLDFSATQSYVDGYVDVGAVRSRWTVDDFDTNDGSDVGWEPISSLRSVFEGNGYSIANLQINRDNTGGVALFAVNIRDTGTIRNLGLSKIIVEGGSNVGGLVASNQGNIINSYVDDSYAGDDRGVTGSGNGTGILVGINTRNGLIVNAYVHGDVSGNNNVGGLVGDNAGRIFNSYAAAAVSGTVSTTDGLGGLVGKSESSTAEIANGYAVGTVQRRSGDVNRMGGLIGYLFEAEVENSYALVEISDSGSSSIDKNLIGVRLLSSISDSYWEIGDQTNANRGGEPKTTAELQMPTMPGAMAGDIYHGWESADWDFGNSTSYPALRYSEVAGIDACDSDAETALPQCGILLPAQPIRDKGLNALLFIRNGAELDTTEAFGSLPSFALSFDHNVTIPYTTEIQLRPYASNDAATISITQVGDMPSRDYFTGKRSGDLSDSILLPRENVPTTLTVVVMDASPTSYNFVIRRTIPDAGVTVDIIAPSPGTTVREGDLITASIGGANEAYYYSLQNAASVVRGQGSGATLNARIPKDLGFAPGATMQSIVLTLLVGNGRNEVSDTIELIVVKVDDGEPQLRLSLSPTALSVDSVVDDPDGAGTFTYQWQERDETDSSWLPISNDPSYSVPDNSTSTIRYRVVVDHTDGQGYMETYRIGPFPLNIDYDGDGLIDVYYLEDLDALRNRLDGSGYGITPAGGNITVDEITVGCPDGSCIGYELLRDLDFRNTRSYIDATAVQDQTTIQDQWTVDDFANTTDTGWSPIGSVDNPFDSIFDGNDYTITNLQINRDATKDAVNDADIALFAALSGNARIENVGLVDVAIEGRGDTGSLVAENKGAIVNSYVQRGQVVGTQRNLGGLVAVNDRDTFVVGAIVNSYANVITTSTDVLAAGALVGSNNGVIRNSYAAGDISSPCNVGGLVAGNGSEAQIVNGYASGDVSRAGECMSNIQNRAGGLVAHNQGTIKTSYAYGRIVGDGTVGGLVGEATVDDTVDSSYWDSDTSGQMDSAGGTSKTTADLQTPMTAGGIYEDWDIADWDFGTDKQYPTLRYTSATDILMEPACDIDIDTTRPPCGVLLLDQRDKGLGGIFFFAGDVLDELPLNLAFSSSVFDYTLSIANEPSIRLLPYGLNARSETISIIRDGDEADIDYFAGKRSGELSEPIPILERMTNLAVSVGDSADDPDPITYRFTINNETAAIEVTDIISDVTMVQEEETISLSATVGGGIAGNSRYIWSAEPQSLLANVATADITSPTLSFIVPADFVSRQLTTQSVVIRLTATDGLSESSATRTVTIEKVNNGDPSFTVMVTTSTISVQTIADDPDGVGTVNYFWQQISADNVNWETVVSTISAVYRVPPQNKGDVRYRVQLQHTDTQGYGFSSEFGPIRNDIDDDDDGLIDIYYLEDLDAVRFQPDGSGYALSNLMVKVTHGCPSDTCNGYELRRDLDFTTTQSYVDALANITTWTVQDFDDTSDLGWQPIGSNLFTSNCTDDSHGCLTSIFEGNGHSISSLQINRDALPQFAFVDFTTHVGLFSGSSGLIRNLELLKLKIEGRRRVGGLVAVNRGQIINSRVSGTIEGSPNSTNIGGLVGRCSTGSVILNSDVSGTVIGWNWVGGICGYSEGRIINSYAKSTVKGAWSVGDLAGQSAGENSGDTSFIINSYAEGSVSARSGSISFQGSFAGQIGSTSFSSGDAQVRNSYSSGDIADNNPRPIGTSLISNSYWKAGTGVTGGQTIAALQMPTKPGTANTEVYYQWNSEDWDFGNDMSYPALRYNEIDGVDGCDANSNTALPRCGTLLPGQSNRDKGLSALFFVIDGEEHDNIEIFDGQQPFSSLLFEYAKAIPATTAFRLRPYAINSTAVISIVKAGDPPDTDYFKDKRSGDLSDDIILRGNTNEMLMIGVEDIDVLYRLNLRVNPEDSVEIVSLGSMPIAGSRVDEGTSITLEVEVARGSGNYDYSLQPGGIETSREGVTTAVLSFTVPEDFVEAGLTTQNFVYKLTVDDGFSTTSAELALIVARADNGNPQLELDVAANLLSINSVRDDPDGTSTFTYVWQRRGETDSSWVTISDSDDPSYSVADNSTSTIRYRLEVTHTDKQGYTQTYRTGPFPINIDDDDDGLIDIYYLEDLNAVRNRLDGSGYSIDPLSDNITANEITLGCPDGGCMGYELLRDLDFRHTPSYIDATVAQDETTIQDQWTVDDFAEPSDVGWLPIASLDTPFDSTFDGNNHTISNLQINRDAQDTVSNPHIALFAAISANARVENVGLSGVVIEGRGDTASLIADNKGVIVNSYALGRVMGTQHRVGGLVAINDTSTAVVGAIVNSYANVITTSADVLSAGALVGSNNGAIRNSYAVGDVSGPCAVGGLVADNGGGAQIVNGYASGDVRATGCTDSMQNRAGGLVAYNEGTIRTSYARGDITGDSSVGGLVAESMGGTVEASYWDSTVNDTITVDDQAQSTGDLQTPITAEGIYEDWGVADWDFGTNQQYPTLRYTSATDTLMAPACDTNPDTALPLCNGLVVGQRDKGLSRISLFINGEPLDNSALDRPFSSSVFAYTITISGSSTVDLNLRPYGINLGEQTISITLEGDATNTNYFAGRRDGELSAPIPIPIAYANRVGLIIRVGNTPDDPAPAIYRFTVINSAVVGITGISPAAVHEGSQIVFSAQIAGGIRSDYRYIWSTQPDFLADVPVADITSSTLSFMVPTDFVSGNVSTRSMIIGLRIEDGPLQSRATGTLLVERVDNGNLILIPVVGAMSIIIETEADDPDGNGIVSYVWEKRSIDDVAWLPIPGVSTMSNEYLVPAQDKGDTRYRVQISYTDAQGYDFTGSSVPLRVDIDDDDDSLIDIYYLEDLDTVRYQPDGSGYTTGVLPKNTSGCPLDICNGYELRRDLDFRHTQSYLDAAVAQDGTTIQDEWTVDDFNDSSDGGWNPIGSLSTLFEGNGFSISNLQILRSSFNAGLFGVNTGIIRNLGLSEIRIRNNLAILERNTAGMVGRNEAGALIINGYVHGRVSGSERVGGLCASNRGRIINSYVNAEVEGFLFVGGLVGESLGSSEIINSYATGTVLSDSFPRLNPHVGGLIGYLSDNAMVKNGYSIAEVSDRNVSIDNSNAVGGLIGTVVATDDGTPTVVDSYWDSTTSGREDSLGGGTSRTTAQLQMPTMADGIYANWHPDDWDFGSMQDYPALRYNEVDDIDACNTDVGTALPRCGILLPGQLVRNKGLNALLFVRNDILLDNNQLFDNRPFFYLSFDYDVTIPYADEIQLRPYANDDTAAISITSAEDAQNTNYFAGKRSGDLSSGIPLPDDNMPTTLTVVVAGAEPTTYHIVMLNLTPDEDITLGIGDLDNGDTVPEGHIINAQVGGGNNLYYYSFAQNGVELVQGEGTTSVLSFGVPTDLDFADDATTRRIVYTISVDNGRNQVSTMIELIVTKTNNGDPQLELNVSGEALSLSHDANDADGLGSYDYLWQRRDEGEGEWTDISRTNRYGSPSNSTATVRYRVLVDYVDGQGHRNDYLVGPFPVDVDSDDDGLIDIYYLEDLHALRYSLDGSGYGLTDVSNNIASGCPLANNPLGNNLLDGGAMVCSGYELLRDLDFVTTQSYIDLATVRDQWTVDDFSNPLDTGWLPIGSGEMPFDSLLNGNNYTIHRLQINRDSNDDAQVGLFAALSGDARIENVALLDVAIEGRGDTGSLAAQNKGVIVNVYVRSGKVMGTQHSLGGLVAINDSNDSDATTAVIVNSYTHVITTSSEVLSSGALVGRNKGVIRNSYAAGNVSGSCDVGGLVAENFAGSQTVNSYASGDVHISGNCMDDGTRDSASGLVGYNEGSVTTSYARGRVTGTGTLGGLVADAMTGTVAASYWDNTVNSDITADDADGMPQSSVALQMPQSATGIYANWSDADWDFGTDEQYPAIKHTKASDILTKPACDDDPDTALPPCETSLLDQRDKGLSGIFFFAGDATNATDASALDRPFSASQFDYTLNIDGQTSIRLLPYGINSQGQAISISLEGDETDTDYFAGKRSGQLSEPISILRRLTNLTVSVGDDADDANPVIYRFTINNVTAAIEVTEIMIDPATVEEGETLNLSATIRGGLVVNRGYRWASVPERLLDDLSEQDISSPTLSFSVPTDFVSHELTIQSAVIKLTVMDGLSEGSATATVTVTKTDSSPNLRTVVTTSGISVTIDDPDGDATADYVWERRSIGKDWQPIPTRSATYRVSALDQGDARYRLHLSYIDAQGYRFSGLLGPFRADIDDDNDGLIDIYYLEDLDALRYQPDGSGYATNLLTESTSGCPLAVCRGYELRRDLDFSSTQSYVDVGAVRSLWTVDDFDTNDGSDVGWQPIAALRSVLEGNGYSVANLQINRDNTNDVALFRVNAGDTLNFRNSGIIRNLGLSKIKVEGRSRVGGLVATNRGNIINSYIDDSYADDDRGVTGSDNGIGILVGINASSGVIINAYVHGDVLGNNDVGGLVGDNAGRIFNSYAVAAVSGIVSTLDGLGGLTGKSEGGSAEIANSYAVGTVHRRSGNFNNMGGLIGYSSEAEVENSYARVEISASGSSTIDRNLMGNTFDSPISDSYWESEGGTNNGQGGEPRTTTELQTPTMPGAMEGDIYYSWEPTNWDFGNNTSYPALRYNEVSGIDACDSDAETALPHCGILLPAQPIRDKGLNALLFVRNGVELDTTEVFGSLPSFSLSFDHDVTIPYTTEIQLRPYAINDAATLAITRAGDMPSRDYFAGKRSGDLSDNILLPRENVPTTLTVVVMDASSISYNFVIRRTVPDTDVTVDISNPSPGATVREGDIIMASIGGANEAYYYSLQSAGSDAAQGQGSGATLNARIPENLSFEAGATTQRIVFTLLVGNGRNEVSDTIELIVVKVDDGEPQLRLSVSPMALSVAPVADDPDGAGTFVYEWQRRDETDSSWLPISNDPSYSVPDNSTSTIRYRVVVNHTDGQDYMQTYRIGPFPLNIDSDDDGLIDVYYLEDLDVLRNHLDGSGYGITPLGGNITADEITLGCPEGGCIGYELLRDLDFRNTQSYIDATAVQDQTTIQNQWTVGNFADATDTGWLPIGSVDNPFDSTFDGNNYTIANLQINRDDINDADIALFAALSGNARIENVGLVDVEIEGRGDTGSLVAENKGAIVNSYVQRGEVVGAQQNLGGLVAINDRDTAVVGVVVNSYASVITRSMDVLAAAALVGSNKGVIRNSYAAGDISGSCDVGGLVADNGSAAEIVNGYASGDVSRVGDCENGIGRAGGLVAHNQGAIKTSYAYGLVVGDGTAGGLVGEATADGTVDSSYWDADTSGQMSSAGGISMTTADLQTPMSATGIYEDWDIADWDFGSSNRYPTLRYTSATDILMEPACDADLDTAIPLCSGLVVGQRDKGLASISFFIDGQPLDNSALNRPFSSWLSEYTLNISGNATAFLSLRPYGINPRGQAISIAREGDMNTHYFVGKRSGELSDPIPIAVGNANRVRLIIRVGSTAGDLAPAAYSFTIINNAVAGIKRSGPATIREGDRVVFSADINGGIRSDYRYMWSADPESLLAETDTTSSTLSFIVPDDFVSIENSTQNAVIQLILRDGSVESRAAETITIVRVDSVPSFTPTLDPTQIDIAIENP